MEDTPDRAEAIAKYRALAVDYDQRTARLDRFRRIAIQRLLLKPGDTVIDVACGTGANFPRLARYVGPRGRIVGIDVSAEMLAAAGRRVESQGWPEVELVRSPVQEATVDVRADAALFSFTHDVLRSPAAVDRVVKSLRPGARVAATGSKWAPRWAVPVNLVVRRVARPYVTTFEGFDQPWSCLEARAGTLQVESLVLGAVYVAYGTVANGAHEQR